MGGVPCESGTDALLGMSKSSQGIFRAVACISRCRGQGDDCVPR
jgi:hypothetical protein